MLRIQAPVTQNHKGAVCRMVWGVPVRPGVSEGVGGVRCWQLARLALLGRVVVHTVELDLIPLLHNEQK